MYKIQLLMVVGSAVVSLYACEALLRYWKVDLLGSDAPIWYINAGATEEKKQEAKELAKTFGVDFDTRSRFEVVSDLEKSGIPAIVSVPPEVLRLKAETTLESPIRIDGKEVFPLGGISNRVTVLCNESGRYVTYLSDERGFSNPKGIWHSPSLEILAVGDSYTHGWCVPPDRTFMAVIRAVYPNTLNLGMAGNGPLLELAGVKEYAEAFKPRVVLWFYFENDLSDLQKEKKVPLIARYLQRGARQGLSEMQEEIDGALVSFVESEKAAWIAEGLHKSRAKEVDYLSRLMGFVTLDQLRDRIGLVYGSSPEAEAMLSDLHGPTMELFREILGEAKNVSERWGGTLYFVYLPGWSHYVNRTSVLEEKREDVLAMARELKIPVIDIHEAFQKHKDPLSLFPFRASGHYNEEGHRLVAQEVLAKIGRLLARSSPRS
jgi:hypothetical protein